MTSELELRAPREHAEGAVDVLRTQVERVQHGETPAAPIETLYAAAAAAIAALETALGLVPAVAHPGPGLGAVESYHLVERRLAELTLASRRYVA